MELESIDWKHVTGKSLKERLIDAYRQREAQRERLDTLYKQTHKAIEKTIETDPGATSLHWLIDEQRSNIRALYWMDLPAIFAQGIQQGIFEGIAEGLGTHKERVVEIFQILIDMKKSKAN